MTLTHQCVHLRVFERVIKFNTRNPQNRVGHCTHTMARNTTKNLDSSQDTVLKNLFSRHRVNLRKSVWFLLFGSIGPLIVPDRADLRIEDFRFLNNVNSSIWPGCDALIGKDKPLINSHAHTQQLKKEKKTPSLSTVLVSKGWVVRWPRGCDGKNIIT